MRLIDAFDRAVSLYPDNVFLKHDNKIINYCEGYKLTCRIASVLIQKGCNLETPVGFLMPNCWQGVLALYGAFRATCPIVPLNNKNALKSHQNQLDAAKVKVLFFHSDFTDTAKNILKDCEFVDEIVCLDSRVSPHSELGDWFDEIQEKDPYKVSKADEPWGIFGTSGTTGKPKYVIQTHLTSMGIAWDMLFAMRIHEPVQHLVVAPVSHFAGSFLFALSAVGSTHHIHQEVNVEAILEAIEFEKIEVLFLPPTVIRILISSPNIHRYDLSSLRLLVYAGAPMSSSEIKLTIKTFGPVLMTMLGQTETNGPITYMRPEDYVIDGDDTDEWRLLSVGRASVTRQVEIMNDQGELLGDCIAGEVVVRGMANSLGYLNDQAATNELFKHGWLHTGDIGIKDKKGYIVLIDRKKDIIITGGFNVFSVEVEQCIASIKGVTQAAVIGIPDEKWGEKVIAVVERDVSICPESDYIVAYCKKELGSIKAPKEVYFVESLPRNAAGKVLKNKIRSKYWKNRNRMIS